MAYTQNLILDTAPNCNRILPGVTRNKVVNIARSLGIIVEERFFTLDEFMRSSECFLTSTIVNISPIVEIDGQIINKGIPGPVTRKLQAAFGKVLTE